MQIAEIAFPVSEEITGGVLTFFTNVGAIGYFILYPALANVPQYQNVVLLVFMVASFIGTLFIRATYNRSQLDGELVNDEKEPDMPTIPDLVVKSIRKIRQHVHSKRDLRSKSDVESRPILEQQMSKLNIASQSYSSTKTI